MQALAAAAEHRLNQIIAEMGLAEQALLQPQGPDGYDYAGEGVGLPPMGPAPAPPTPEQLALQDAAAAVASAQEASAAAAAQLAANAATAAAAAVQVAKAAEAGVFAWNINVCRPEELKIMQHLADGSYGRVSSGFFDGVMVAIKEYLPVVGLGDVTAAQAERDAIHVPEGGAAAGEV
jgi:hypothetical protein